MTSIDEGSGVLFGSREPGTFCFKRFARRGALASSVWVPRSWLAACLDQCASAAVIVDLMFVPDTLIVNCSAICSMFLYRYCLPDLTMNLTWTAISFALLFPLQTSIREAYRRREQALMSISDFRGTMLNVFLANQLWDWPGGDTWWGRSEDNVPISQGGKGVKKGSFRDTPLSPLHSTRVYSLLLRLVDALQELLLVPRRGRSRQEYCRCLSPEKELVEAAETTGRQAVLRLLARLHKATEELKAAGMPANEASRINQYNLFLTRDFERLWSFKTYRTPTSLRSVSRFCIQAMPLFFGPYYLHIARDPATSEFSSHRLAFALIFSCVVSTILVALLNVATMMENPFRPDCRDTIRVQEEFDLCRDTLSALAADAEAVWHERMEFEWERL
eukprot:TRINITY_DN108502_c0_g1_i1.p1 TRINITY_DN108502_c0_g1~~TRINITY_DN108502_c0_g1_i1.p1  ORF type:complete len:390 (+),score=59.21 TRINITY_DN108502_c0_g1_i1:163-1332(+)